MICFHFIYKITLLRLLIIWSPGLWAREDCMSKTLYEIYVWNQSVDLWTTGGRWFSVAPSKGKVKMKADSDFMETVISNTKSHEDSVYVDWLLLAWTLPVFAFVWKRIFSIETGLLQFKTLLVTSDTESWPELTNYLTVGSMLSAFFIQVPLRRAVDWQDSSYRASHWVAMVMAHTNNPATSNRTQARGAVVGSEI